MNQDQTKDKIYGWNSTRLNPDYKTATLSSLRSCPIHDNDTPNRGGISCEPTMTPYALGDNLRVRLAPKWITELNITGIDPDTGEAELLGYHTTNDFKASNYRKIKVLHEYADVYQELYRKRETSMLMHTFTEAEKAHKTIRRVLNKVKDRYDRIGHPIRGYMWTLEISERFHFHYHLIVTTQGRLDVRGGKIPDELKFEGLWGRRTGAEFAKKNVTGYLMKYFAKNSYRIEGLRQFGRSRNFV